MPCIHNGGTDPCVRDKGRSCKARKKAYAREYYAQNKKRELARAKRYHEENRNDPDYAYHRHVLSVRTRGLVNELTQEQYAMLMSQPCAYCGHAASTNGVDRVKNEFGYTLLNSVPCCKTCNFMKSRLEVKAFVIAINAAAKHSPDYETFKKRWVSIRRKLERMRT